MAQSPIKVLKENYTKNRRLKIDVEIKMDEI